MDKIQELIGDDQIILKKQEHIVSVFFRFIKGVGIFIIFTIIASIIIYVTTGGIILPILISLIAFIVSFFYIRVFYKDTFILVTNSKILKSVRSGLFSSHIVELPISRVRQIRANNNGIFAKIFGFGDIEIQGFDESSNMYFKAMSQNKKAMSTISNVVESIKKN